MEIDLYNEYVSNIINGLSDIIRNDYVSDNNNLELYAGQETIQAINNKNIKLYMVEEELVRHIY